MGSNHSKPYQAQLIRQQGFKTPETLITNDPALVKKFLQKHKRIIYKSISSIRSIVQILEDQDLKRLDQIRWCPVQFQKYIEGTNIRVHTIGRKVFATSIKTSVTDYRYSNENEHETVNLEPFDLSEKLKKMCLKLSESLKLDFAGIDLKIDNKKRVYCFEVNPSPGYSYYESQTGQPISRTLAQYLAGNN
jgi:glutathione synthase/RimK-type ligase-like ATP-grasp enzyme